MKAIRIEEFGGPEVMKHAEVPDPEPADGMVVVDVARAGRQLRRYPRDPQRLPRRADAAADPRGPR